MIMRVGAAEGWNLRKIDKATALRKSDPVKRKVWLIPAIRANPNPDEVWSVTGANYGLADGPIDFCITLGKFLTNHPP